jgi:hypothetical protein
VVIDATAFGAGQEHHTLKPVMENVLQRYRRLDISEDIYAEQVIVTADTGFANEQNMKMLYDHEINAFIPGNKFRSRDPKFQDQKEKYGKRPSKKPKSQSKGTDLIPASEFEFEFEFEFDQETKTCICPQGKQLRYRGQRTQTDNNTYLMFEGRLRDCRDCPINKRCMKNPASAQHRNGNGRQVSFVVDRKHSKPYTEWMKPRVDSPEGKAIYGHRMSVVEPVFGNIGTNKGLDRFTLRGQEKVDGQWKMFCMIQNIEKLFRYGELSY